MQQGCRALWVSGKGTIDLSLRKVLIDAGLQVQMVRSCAEVWQVLADGIVPAVMFCDTLLPDGTWADVLTMATGGALQIPVIVVSRVVDINLYINALEMGATDFIVPPFYHQEVSHVLECSMRKDVAIQAPAVE